MFCPYCGTESSSEMKYCKRCGGNLGTPVQVAAQETRPAPVKSGVAWAAGLSTASVVVIGIGIIFPITTELASRGVNWAALVWIAFFIAIAVFGCTAMLLRFWSMLLGIGPGSARRTPGAGAAAAPTGQLDERRFDALGPAPVPSITEQTTRTLDNVKRR